MSPSDEREKILPCKGGLGDVATMSQRCRNDVVMGVLPEKGINGTLWNVMGPVRNGDRKGNGRSRNGYTGRTGRQGGGS